MFDNGKKEEKDVGESSVAEQAEVELIGLKE
jgi:hypothetical protein